MKVKETNAPSKKQKANNNSTATKQSNVNTSTPSVKFNFDQTTTSSSNSASSNSKKRNISQMLKNVSKSLKKENENDPLSSEEEDELSGDEEEFQSEEEYSTEEEENPSSSKQTNKKQKKSEIDDIFGILKDKEALQDEIKKQVQIERKNRQEKNKELLAKLREKSGDEDDDFSNMRGQQKQRKTIDGLKVYTEDELKLGKGGDTPLCPFEFCTTFFISFFDFLYNLFCSCKCCF